MDRRVHDRLRDLSAGHVRPATVLNPLRSEGEAFRLLIYVMIVFAVIIAVVVILRAVL